jgi:hypothetical protein
MSLGLKQIYGSQIQIIEGKEVVCPTEDESGIDIRRRALDFYPVSWCAYLRMFDLEEMPRYCQPKTGTQRKLK